MYMNVNGNIAAVCVIVSKPTFKEEVGEYKIDMTTALARCKEATPDGVQTVNVDLLFTSGLAVPAMKLSPGMVIIALGRESVKEVYLRGRNKLEHSVYVEWWLPREIDPAGMTEQLKARREILCHEDELKLFFARSLTECKPTIIQWVITWCKENVAAIINWFKESAAALKAKRPDALYDKSKQQKEDDQKP